MIIDPADMVAPGLPDEGRDVPFTATPAGILIAVIAGILAWAAPRRLTRTGRRERSSQRRRARLRRRGLAESAVGAADVVRVMKRRGGS